MIQNLVVALIVAFCTGYAVWTLMPSALRRASARGLQRWPWPQALSARLRRAAQQPTGCACDGCDAKKPVGSPNALRDGAQPIRIHRAPKR